MNHDDLAAGCQSFDGAKEVHRANERIPRTTGGRGGIRTLEAVLPPTRFPVARTRPGYATLPDWLSTIGHRPWFSTRPHRLTDSPTPSRRRGWDSNPRWLITTPLFESGTFNHSDTSPTRQVYQRGLARRLRNGDGTQQNRPAVTGRHVRGTPGRIRTCGLWVRNPTLYPLSYRRVSIILHQ
jgi:hypothetical protein